MGLLSPAQVVGYFAFILGVTAFVQRTDGRLKAFNATQSLFYALHFLLLGNNPASATCVISSVRSFMALKYRALWLAGVFVTVNLWAGATLGRTASGWLPVIGSCAATVAIFVLTGVGLRLVLLSSTLLWLANNILSGSIGGTLLEVANASINLLTIVRLVRSPERLPRVRPLTLPSADAAPRT
jgi:hypothetical protein